jgi:putative DNA primase/helicase
MLQNAENPDLGGPGSPEVRDTDQVTTPTVGLSPAHREFLTGQAVKIEVAEELGVRSLLSRADNPQDGTVWENFANHPAILFPWVSPTGEQENQVRPDDPTTDTKGRKRKYMWRKDARITMWALRPLERPRLVLIVEGTKQGLVAASYAPDDVAVYAIGGCRMWQKDGRPIPDLQVVDGRDVVICLDSDTATNLDVYRSGEDLDAALVQEGATSVRFTRLVGGEKDGLDDIMAARPEPGRAAFLARAIEGAKEKPADKRPKGKAGPPAGGAELLPAPTDPMAVSRVIEPEMKAAGGAPTVRHWRGGWWEWQTAHWAEIEALAMSKRLYARTEHAQYIVETKDGQRAERWSPTKPKIANLSDALAGIFLMEADTKAPTWVWGEDRKCGTIVSCQNGLLRLNGRELMDHDAAYFNLVSVPFDYQADAPEPVEWLKFLATVWPDGGEGQVAALQEWFGYVISGRLDFEKIFGIIGPPRSGKGTIAAVLVELVGALNVAGPTLASLATNFGLQPLLGKSVAIIDDARIGRSVDTSIIVERLLSISGQGVLTVDRKHKTHWEGRIPARIMLLSNELPRFSDGSGTIATRFVVTETTHSFLGKEDRGLKARLMAELPGILNWALAGLDRLLSQSQFTETEISTDAVDMMRGTASPFAPFVDEECIKDPKVWVSVDDLWDAWEMWCAQNGRQQTGTKQWLGRDLKSVVPGAKLFKPTVDGKQIRAYRGVALRAPVFTTQALANTPGSSAHTPESGSGVDLKKTRIGADIPIAREAENVSRSEEEGGSSPNKGRSSNIRAYPSLSDSGDGPPASTGPVHSFCNWGNWEHVGPDDPCDLCDD